MTGLARTATGWRLEVAGATGLSTAVGLVLVGRSSGQEVTLPLSAPPAVAAPVVERALLGRFPVERVDLWWDLGPDTGRQRVVVGSAAAVATATTPGVRWYATVKHNLSVVLDAPVGGQPSEQPVLVGLADVPGGTALEVWLPRVTGARAAAARPPELVLTGRRRRRTVSLTPTPDPDRWGASVNDRVVVAVRSGVAAASVQWRHEDLLVRRPVVAAESTLRAGPGPMGRWSTDETGRLRVRRATAPEVITESGTFDAEFYRSQVPGLPADADPVEHYVNQGAAEGLDPSPMFATAHYRRMNSGLPDRNPLAHYCETGWRELLNPAPDFDTWWYWAKHLDLADDTVNPLAHYQTVGRHRGLSTRPDRHPSRGLGPGHRLDASRPPRRLCLFAGYDADGVVDDYVLAYVRELARHADVYYLADSAMREEELAKLLPYTRGAWGVRHGAYDFGSYARLVERIGWPEIEGYDELLLVNDSGYLLRPLDGVFERMAERPCDWWGLQATKGIYATRDVPANQFDTPIPMERVRSSLVDEYELDYRYDFLIGSYFLAYRQPVLRDPAFRRYLASVTTQPGKRAVVLRYEVGLTRWLIQHGHAFDTFVTHLYPFHPVYTWWYLRLLDEGFPLLKRFFLTENHYRAPGLWRWAELVAEKVPGADIASFERNLARVTDPASLHRSLHVGEPGGPEGAPPDR